MGQKRGLDVQMADVELPQGWESESHTPQQDAASFVLAFEEAIACLLEAETEPKPGTPRPPSSALARLYDSQSILRGIAGGHIVTGQRHLVENVIQACDDLDRAGLPNLAIAVSRVVEGMSTKGLAIEGYDLTGTDIAKRWSKRER